MTHQNGPSVADVSADDSAPEDVWAGHPPATPWPVRHVSPRTMHIPRDSDEDQDVSKLVHTISRQRAQVSSVRRAVLDEGVRLLKQAHKLCRMSIVCDRRPTIFVEMPAMDRAADIRPDEWLFVPCGWDTPFGGALTIAPLLDDEDLGRLYVDGLDSPVIDALTSGQFTCVITKNRVPASAIVVDMHTTDESTAMWRGHINRARNCRGSPNDSLAKWWYTLGKFPVVMSSGRLRPHERLSMGWMVRYTGIVEVSERLLSATKERRADILTHMTSHVSDIAAAWLRSICLQSATVGSLVQTLRDMSSGRPEIASDILCSQLWSLLPDVYGGEDRVAGRTVSGQSVKVPTTAGALVRELTINIVEAFSLCSEFTQCGLRVPLLDGRDLRFRQLQPDAWGGNDPATYWPRLHGRLPGTWNTLITGADFPADLRTPSGPLASMPVSPDRDGHESNLDAAEQLLTEAITSKKWTVPPQAVLEMRIGDFARVELRERGNIIDFALRTTSGEFSDGGIRLALNDYNIWWSGTERSASQEEHERRAKSTGALFLLLAAMIRDFMVVDEREAVFQQRVSDRTTHMLSHDNGAPRVIYLPRVQYKRGADHDRLALCRTELNLEAVRAAHAVRAHIRKSAAASTEQLVMARRYGVEVPSGYTFVRPHDRGARVRDVIYRSRSALRCLYAHVDSVIGQVHWFQFERDVAALMSAIGFAVEHVAASKSGDDGIDVYATRGYESWIIQCKCYALTRMVGPSVIRELIGTVAISEHQTKANWMVVTTSDFSTKARDVAERGNVRLVNGSQFAALLKDPSGWR